jgi:hypothetical protein
MNRQGTPFHALGGHLVDLWRLAKFDIRNPHSYSKTRQLRALAHKTQAKTFVETGTFLGNTTRRLSGSFNRIVTIELDDDLFRQASAYLKPYKNVECLKGDASKLLPQVMQRSDVTEAVIFLDGHFSGGVTAHGDVAEPACEEIETLGKFKQKVSGIVVDDFREFGNGTWPKRSTLIAAVESHLGPEFDFTVHMDQLVVWKRSAVAGATK